MKKTTRYFQTLFAILLSLYVAKAFAFVDPPTFAPIAPNSTQPIVVSVRSGICHGFGVAPGPGIPLERIEFLPGIVDIYAPGIIAFAGACNLDISTHQFNVPAIPAGNYQVRIWLIDIDIFTNTVLLASSAPLVVAQGPTIQTLAVPTLGVVGCIILVLLVFLITLLNIQLKRAVSFTIFLLCSSSIFAQSNEKVLPVLLSAAPGAPAPIDLVEPVSFSGGYLGVLSAGFVAENPIRACYLLPKPATRCSVSMQTVASQKLTPRNYL